MARPCNYCCGEGRSTPDRSCAACMDNVRAEEGGAVPYAGELFNLLNELVYLKEFKPSNYEERKPVIWREARALLDKIREGKPNA